MKIRNTSSYILTLTENKPVQKFGNDALFHFLQGKNNSLKTYIGGLTSFADNSGIQLFYEFLQNADDAHATTIRYYFDEENLLIINNGLPFYTDKPDKDGKTTNPGQLQSILGKGGSKKEDDENEQEGSGFIGKHGQGAKLIFEFLTESSEKTETALRQALLKELKGPIIFSWNDWSSIETLKNLNPKDISLKQHDDISYPLLTKLIYSYYPSYVNERKTIKSEEITLFSEQEFHQFRTYCTQQIKRNSEADLTKGTMFYIRLGKGQMKRITDDLERIKSEIAISLNFLSNVEKVTINDSTIQKSQLQNISLTDSEKRPFQLCIPNSISSNQEFKSNFFQYFPITKEIHGFQFIVNSKYFDIDNGRQNIKEKNEYNDIILDDIASTISSYLISLSNRPEAFNQLINLYTSILNSKKAYRNDTFQSFYDKLKNTISTNIPIEGGFESNVQNVTICETQLNITPKELGIDNLEIINKKLLPLKTRLAEILGIKITTTYDLVIQANNNLTFINWIASLNKKDYFILLEEISENLKSFKSIQNIKLFRGSDNNFYSLNDAVAEDNIFFVSPRIENIKEILLRNNSSNIVIGDGLITNQITSQLSLIKNIITSYFNEKEEKLFIKIRNALKRKKLNHQDKRSLVKNFVENFTNEKRTTWIKEQLEIFRKQNNQFDVLGNLLSDTSQLAPSGLLYHTQINAPEHSDSYSQYYLAKKSIWSFILNNWKSHIQPVLSDKNTEFSKIYTDFINLSNLAGKDIENLESYTFVKTLSGQIVESSEIFYNDQLLKLSKEAYEETILLVQKLSTYKVVSQSDLMILSKNKKLFGLKGLGFSAIKNKVSEDDFTLTYEELELFKNLKNYDSLFSSFLITEKKGSPNSYQLSLKKAKEIQYYCEDNSINEYLKSKEKYYLLPKEIKELFSKENLLNDLDELALKLLDEFGSAEAFIGLILGRNEKTKKRYLHGLPILELSTDEEYSEISFESQLITKLLMKEEWEEDFRSKIKINDKPLGHYTFEDEVSVKVNKRRIVFSLAALLPDYAGISDVLKNIKSSFVDKSVHKFSLFKADKKDVIELKNELHTKGIKTLVQIEFAICYRLSKKGEEDKSFIIPNLTNENEYASLLTFLFNNEISKYTSIYQIGSFKPSQCILVSNTYRKFSHKNEQIPKWVSNWLANDNIKQEEEKVLFLKECGVHEENSDYIQLRVNIEEDKLFSIDKTAKNNFFTQNTLEWTLKHVGKQLISNSFRYLNITNLIAKNMELHNYHFPSYLIQIEKVQETKTVCSIISTDSLQNKLYIKSNNNIENIVKGAEALNKKIVDLSGAYTTQHFNAINLSEATFKREFHVGSVGKPSPWNIYYYNKWINQEDIEFRIFLSGKKLPFEQFLVFDGKPHSFDISNDGSIERQDNENEKLKKIYIHKQSFPSSLSILNILEQNKDKLFKSSSEKDQFIQLLHLAIPSNTERELLKTLKEKGIADTATLIEQLSSQIKGTSEEVSTSILSFLKQENPSSEVVDFISNNFNQILNASHTGSIGRYDLDIDLSKEQLAKLNNSIIQVLDLLDRFSPEDLIQLGKEGYLDYWKEVIDEESRAEPMLHVGLIGERLVYLYYKEIKKDRIEHTALPPQKTPEYDLILHSSQSKEIKIDVKSTIQSLWGNDGSVPFYVKRSQYRYIEDNPNINYFIFRLSLEDLKIQAFAKQYKGKIDTSNKNQIKEIDNYLLDKLKNHSWVQEFERCILFFRVQAPKTIKDIFDLV